MKTGGDREHDLIFAEVFSRAVGQILSEAEQRKKKLVIQYAGEGKTIPLNDIYYMESQNHNSVLFLKSGKLEYYGKIGDLEEELAGQFYRIHRGCLINLFHVESYDRTEGAGTAKETATRKTAADELSYLSEKYECLKSPNYSVKKTAERRAGRKKLAEGREAGTFTVSATGTDVKSVT